MTANMVMPDRQGRSQMTVKERRMKKEERSKNQAKLAASRQ